MPASTTTLPQPGRVADRHEDALWRQDDECPDDATIADLSSKHISRMTRGELVRVVRAARTPAASWRIERYDRATLERLAHQARLCCQHRLH